MQFWAPTGNTIPKYIKSLSQVQMILIHNIQVLHILKNFWNHRFSQQLKICPLNLLN